MVSRSPSLCKSTRVLSIFNGHIEKRGVLDAHVRCSGKGGPGSVEGSEKKLGEREAKPKRGEEESASKGSKIGGENRKVARTGRSFPQPWSSARRSRPQPRSTEQASGRTERGGNGSA